ncbi:MAG: response regulator, partial [Hymenobacter sp.]
HELQLQPSDSEFISFVQEASDAFKDLAEKKNIRFTVTSGLEQLYTRFDQDKIERIVFNLLSNAFKFTLKGGTISLKIDKNERRSTENVSWICLLVKDTGIGIPADQKDKIFDRFFQHTTAGSVLNQGTGIGLSITKEFVELHGGSISVVSEPGQGTTFTVQLPLVLLPSPANEEAQPVATDVDNVAEELSEMLPNAELVPETNAIPLSSILLVEDDEDFRFYLKDNLQQYYKVYEAANGKEGWQKALALHPQLIVSDVSMPYMDGIELCKKLKGDKRTAHIPIILLTALTAEGDQLKGLETGANDYITKPFNFEVLNAKVKNLLVLNHTLKSTYTKQIKVAAPEVQVDSEDEKLMTNIMHYLEENLTNSQLSVEELSRQVSMSRSSLYSKLLELTGQTPVEFIRSV